MPGNIISLTPADMAAWPAPNYDDPPERSWLPLGAGLLYGFSTTILAFRLCLRLRKQAGGLGLDDLMLTIAWLGSTMYTTAAIIAAVVYHVGRNIWNIPLPWFEKIALLAWLGEFSFLATGGCIKISVLLFYRRIVAGTYSRAWKWSIIGAICFTGGWTIALMLTLVFNCMPTEAYWKTFNPMYTRDFTCVDTTAVNLMAGIFAIVSDLYAVVLPAVMTWKLQINRTQRIALNTLFGLSLAVSGISGVRTYYLYEVGQNTDVSSMIFNVFWWAQLELQLSIILTSIPALRTFFRTYVVSTISRYSKSFNSNSKSNDHADRLSFVDIGDGHRQSSCVERGTIEIIKDTSVDVYDESFDLERWGRNDSAGSGSGCNDEKDGSHGSSDPQLFELDSHQAPTLPPPIRFSQRQQQDFSFYDSHHQRFVEDLASQNATRL